MDQRVPAATCAGRKPPHTRPSRACRAAGSARATAGGRVPPQRPTRFSQSPATLLPADRGGQADSPMVRPAQAKRGAPVAAVAQRARVAIICTAAGQISAPDFRAQTWAHCDMVPVL
jgi:hypothetical protein